MLEKITYFPILGKPLLVYLGIIGLLLLIFTASIPILCKKGYIKNHFKMHILFARICIGFAIVHGVLYALSMI